MAAAPRSLAPFSFSQCSSSPPLLLVSPTHFSPLAFCNSPPRLLSRSFGAISYTKDSNLSCSLGFRCRRSSLQCQLHVSSPSARFQMTLADLLQKSGAAPLAVHGDPDVLITGMQRDSREVRSGDLFVCCVGTMTDGHLYLDEACARGAAAVIVVADREIDKDRILGSAKALVVVEDTNSLLPGLAANFFGHPSKHLCVVAITGTNGKTTTTNLVKSMLEAMGHETGMLGTLGYFVNGGNKIEAPNTTPDALTTQRLMAEMVEDGTSAVVMEASSHGLAMGRCDEIDFDVAVFTNLTRDHLDYHGTEEEYRKSKGKLFARMVDPQRQRKVVNLDDPNAAYFIKQGSMEVPLVTFAMENKNADVRPLDCELSLFRTRVSVSTPRGTVEITSGMHGRYNIYNILAAVAVGIAVGGKLEDIVRGIAEVDGVPGRCELIDEGQPFAVIVDYAHTPDALSRLLDAMGELRPSRIITVFGCGGERDQGKRPLMAKIAVDKSDIVILTSDNPRNEDPFNILDEMLRGIGLTMEEYIRYGGNRKFLKLPNSCELLVHDVRRVALQAAIATGKEGDIIIVAGKGHETYQIEGNTKKYFDDRVECRDALHYLHELHQAGIDRHLRAVLGITKKCQ